MLPSHTGTVRHAAMRRARVLACVCVCVCAAANARYLARSTSPPGLCTAGCRHTAHLRVAASLPPPPHVPRPSRAGALVRQRDRCRTCASPRLRRCPDQTARARGTPSHTCRAVSFERAVPSSAAPPGLDSSLGICYMLCVATVWPSWLWLCCAARRQSLSRQVALPPVCRLLWAGHLPHVPLVPHAGTPS